MTTRPKNSRHAARDAAPRASVSALRPDASGVSGRVWIGLHIIAPPDWDAPCSATAACRCGYRRHANDRAGALRVVHDYNAHRAECRALDGEGREAA